MKVWRIHIKNDVEDGYTRKDLLEFCLQNKLIGVGWNDIKTRADSVSEIKKEAQSYSNATAGFKAVNAVRQMNLNDLIWTRLEGIYYLCRVTGLWKDSRPDKTHYSLDISNYVNVEWLKIGTEDLVPGKVVSSFRPAASAQCINGVEEITAYLWNKYSKTDKYERTSEKMDIWNVLSAESIEELVLLYLQVKEKYYIYSTTMKFTTKEYECVMVNENGTRAFPQVKSGAVSLSADDYMDAVKLDPTARIFLFSASEDYKRNNCDNIHYLKKKDLETFIAEYRTILPSLTESWIDLCNFFN